MSGKIAIRVSHLGKKYRLGGPQEPYHTFRDVISNSLKAPMKILHKPPQVEGFWAVKDVSFEIEEGEVVGIIGRNGAGKSTLLKILSRITKPTEGKVELYGRVGSLLEVGTGFHPELTGRENIFLSGSILGMQKREIEEKFDEIVKFADIEKFIDTPVKRYSSGMYVRLAFAVAAHMEPEILIVDEVLAVGDASFQKKCLGKMGDVAKQGRTVIFVSHNMAAVQNLCDLGIVLENGSIAYNGNIENAVRYYLGKSFHIGHSNDLNALHHEGTQRIRFKKFEIKNSDGETIISSGSPLVFYLTLETKEKFDSSNVNFGIGINNLVDDRLVTLFTKFDHSYLNNSFIIENNTQITCSINGLPLISNSYKITLYVDIDGELSDHLVNQIQIEISENDFYGTGNLPSSNQGPVLIVHRWDQETNNKFEN